MTAGAVTVLLPDLTPEEAVTEPRASGYGGAERRVATTPAAWPLELAGRVGYPFFGKLISDCLHRTEHAMTQAHALRPAKLCLKVQALADIGTP